MALHSNIPSGAAPWPARLRAVAAATVAAATVLLSTACQDGTAPEPRQAADSLLALPRSLSVTEGRAVTSGNQFAFRLLQQVDRGNADNVLLSPLSVSYALGLTMNGAAGRTLSEMQQVLGWQEATRPDINAAYRDLMTLLPTIDSSDVTIQIANGIWVRSPNQPDPEFVADAQRYFRAPVQVLPTPRAMFDSVNAWGARHTRNMVPRVLTGDPPDDLMMLLANSVYFAGTWRDRFERERTRARPFALESGASVSIPLMSRDGGFRAAMLAGDATGMPALMAAELPYGNSAFSMLLIAPTVGPVSSLVQWLDTAAYGRVLRALSPAPDRAELAIPKFTISRSRALGADLASLGMPSAFGSGAEFPRLFPTVRTAIGLVQHGVAVSVDEQGTRAAAVTAVGIVPVSMPASYVFDRPFVFVIRERFSGAVLFTGVVRDPRG